MRQWLRRGRIGWIVCGTAVLITMLRNTDWSIGWLWMISTINGSAMLLSPAIGGLVALQCVQSWRRSLRSSLPASMRLRGLGSIVLANLVQGWSCMGVAAVVGSAVCLFTHARWDVIWPTQLVVGAVALIPSAFLGALAGCISESVLTIPSVFLALFLSHVLLWGMGAPQFFSPDLPTAPMFNFALAPVRLHLEIFGNLALGGALWASLRLLETRSQAPCSQIRWWIVLGVLSGCVVAVWVLVSRFPAYYEFLGKK